MSNFLVYCAPEAEGFSSAIASGHATMISDTAHSIQVGIGTLEANAIDTFSGTEIKIGANAAGGTPNATKITLGGATTSIEMAGKIEPPATSNVVIKMADAAGVYKVSYTDSADAEVARIDSDGNAQFDGAVTVDGNLTVNGTTTTVGSATLDIGDNLILVNTAAASGNDAGMLAERFQDENGAGTGDVVSDTAAASGTSTAGDGTHITLQVGSSAVDDYYNDWWIKITNDSPAGVLNQVRKITDYVGATRVAEVSGWSTNPDATTTYNLYNRPYVGTFYDESADAWTWGATASDPGVGPVVITDYVDGRLGNTLHIGGVAANVTSRTATISFHSGTGAAAVDKAISLDAANSEFDFSTGVNVTGPITGSNGLTLTTAGITMTGLDLGATGAEVGDLFSDGYLRMAQSSTPSQVVDKGFLYTKDDSGDVELFYYSDLSGVGTEVQITKDGSINADAIPGTSLDGAYNNGRTITVDAGPIVLNTTTTSGGTLDINPSGPLAETAYQIPITFGAVAWTGTPHGLQVDYSGTTSITNAGNTYAVQLTGKTQAGGGQNVGLQITGFDLGVDINDPVDIDAGGTVTIDAVGASNFTTDAGNLVLRTTTSGSLDLDGIDGVTIDSTSGGVSLDAAAASNFTVDNANLTLSTTTLGLVVINAFDDVTIDAGDGISLDAAAASNFTVDSANLTLSTTTSGNVNVTAADQVNLSDGTLTLNLNGGALSETGLTTLSLTGSGAYTVTSGAAMTTTCALSSTWSMVATTANPEVLTIDAVNGGAGTAKLVLDADEYIELGGASNPTITQVGTGTVTFLGNVDATLGLDVSVAALTMTGTNIDLDPTGTFSLDMDATKAATITVADDLADAFLIQEGANAYLDVTTTDASEAMNFGNTTTNPAYSFLGSGTFTQSGAGQVTFNGNVDAANGLDVPDSKNLTVGTGADLTIAHDTTNTTVTSATGNLILDNTNATGATILQLGTDTSATAIQFKDNTGNVFLTASGDRAFDVDAAAASSFSVTGANLTLETITSGTLALDSAGAITIAADSTLSISTVLGSGAGPEIDLTAANGAAGTFAGGALDINAGTGGAATGSAPGGVGGTVSVNAGDGGAGSTTYAAGDGAVIDLSSGDGGAGGTTGNAGAGGNFTFNAGTGGASGSTDGEAGGDGGLATINAGAGGNSTADNGDGGVGGDFVINSGAGGTGTGTGVDGAGGLIKLNSEANLLELGNNETETGSKQVRWGWGTSLPANSTGYGKGSVFIKVDVPALYMNEGTEASVTWNLVGQQS